MKNEIQTLINLLFWEKYIDIISEANYKELTKEFLKVIKVTVPSAHVLISRDELPELNTTVFVVTNFTVKI